MALKTLVIISHVPTSLQEVSAVSCAFIYNLSTYMGLYIFCVSVRDAADCDTLAVLVFFFICVCRVNSVFICCSLMPALIFAKCKLYCALTHCWFLS